MNVSPNELRKQTVTTLKNVDRALEDTSEGSVNWATLLSAKAQCLNTLVLLNEPKR